jgi:hypothetical protein
MTLSRMRRSTSVLGWLGFTIIAIGPLAGMPRMAHAEDEVDDVEDAKPLAAGSVETGAFLPSALSSSSDGRSGLATVTVGYDQARGGGTYDTAAEARVVGPVSLLAGATHYVPGTGASPRFELRLDTLDRRKHGVDMAVAVGYSGAGFNTVPATVMTVAAGRNVGPAYVLTNVLYGHGMEDGERYGEVRLAALYALTGAAHVGFDSRFQIDLERDDDEPAGETEWESRSGLVANYAWDRFVLTSGAGISALRFRTGEPTSVGAVITAGFGTVF